MWSKIFVLIFFSSAYAQSDPRRLFADRSDDIQGDIIDDLSYRLPNNSRPIKYNLFVTTDIHRDEREFQGEVEIQIEVLENSNSITLHYRQITITNVDLFNSSNSLIEPKVNVSYQEDVEFLIIKPLEPLTRGKIYWVKISYQGFLRDDNMGFYRSTYIDKNGKTVPYAATKFEPHNARHAFPW